ncbi:transcriptional activator RinB, partial [Staphylococcus haemolyticus]|nr:transcriptional regulator [Staphylococcus haemolyticus]MCE4993311.1 transcriptional regulator [Staphylococcus haemolyticus]
MIKRLLKIWFTIAIYELGKYITNQILIKVQA